MLNVTFVLCNQMLATSVTLPLEQLRAADELKRSQAAFKNKKKPQVEIKLVSVDGNPVFTHTGLKIVADGNMNQYG